MTDPAKFSDKGQVDRLLGETDQVGRLLLEVSETEFRTPPGEFARLVAVRDERARRHRVFHGSAALVPAFAVLFALWWRGHEGTASLIAPEAGPRPVSSVDRSIEPARELAATSEPVRTSAPTAEVHSKPERAVVRPESVRAGVASRRRALAAAPSEVAPPVGLVPRALEPLTGAEPLGSDAAPPAAEGLARSADAVPVASGEAKLSLGSAPGASPLPPHRAQDCQELMQAERYAAASQCQAARAAQSTGTAAELALLNQARIETKALGRPELALQTLLTYRKRFPRGALVREAEIAEKQAQKALSSQANRR